MTCSPIIPALPGLLEPADCCGPTYNYISNGGWASEDGTSWDDLGPFSGAASDRLSCIISPGWAATLLKQVPAAPNVWEIEQDGTVTVTGTAALPPVAGNWDERRNYIQMAPNGNFLAPVLWSSMIAYSLSASPFSWVLKNAFISSAWPLSGYAVPSSMMKNAVAININSHLVVPCYVDGYFGNPDRLTCFQSTDCVTWTEYASAVPPSGGGWFVDDNGILSGVGYGINGLALIAQKMRGAPGQDITFMSLTSTTLTLPLAGNSLSIAVRAALSGFPVFAPYDFQLLGMTYTPLTHSWLLSLIWQKTISDPLVNLWCVSNNDGASWTTYVKPALYDSSGSRVIPTTLVPSVSDESLIGSGGLWTPFASDAVVKYDNVSDAGSVIFERSIPSRALGDCIFPITPSAAQRP
jgi:hypothetical protein